jgi:thymidylate synthase (FAD)
MSENTTAEQYDVMTLLPNKTIKLLDYGHATLVDCMPRFAPVGYTADAAIVQAARVSYGDGTKKLSEDRGLIRYLMRHSHTTPFEMVEFKFHCKMPIFVARQWIRHRTANVNEISGRYSVMKDEFYKPDAAGIRRQSKTNKQGGDTPIDFDTAADYLAYLDEVCIKAYQTYEKYIGEGVSREQARMILPLNLYTEWYWKIDLHNLFHFLSLRCDAHAQEEIRVFANAMLELISPLVPYSVEAWNDYHFRRQGLILTRLEVEALRKMLGDSTPLQIESDNSREKEEWKGKLARLGIQKPFEEKS